MESANWRVGCQEEDSKHQSCFKTIVLVHELKRISWHHGDFEFFPAGFFRDPLPRRFSLKSGGCSPSGVEAAGDRQPGNFMVICKVAPHRPSCSRADRPAQTASPPARVCLPGRGGEKQAEAQTVLPWESHLSTLKELGCKG